MTDIDPGCPLDEVTGQLRTGRLHIPRLHVCELNDAPDAMKRIEAEHTVGKYVIRI